MNVRAEPMTVDGVAEATARRVRQPRQPIEVRREQVLDAALELISEEGYGAVTMEAVARKADLAKPVVYNAFPGREPLLNALLEREKNAGFAVLAAAMQPKLATMGNQTMDVVMAWLSTFAHAIAEDPRRWRLILTTDEQSSAEVRALGKAGRKIALEQLGILLAPALARSAPARSVDVELVAHAVLAVGEHCARLMLDDPTEYPPQRLLAFAEVSLKTLKLI